VIHKPHNIGFGFLVPASTRFGVLVLWSLHRPQKGDRVTRVNCFKNSDRVSGVDCFENGDRFDLIVK